MTITHTDEDESLLLLLLSVSQLTQTNQKASGRVQSAHVVLNR